MIWGEPSPLDSDEDPATFSLGLVSDVQYAPIPDAPNFTGEHMRSYRGTLKALEHAVRP